MHEPGNVRPSFPGLGIAFGFALGGATALYALIFFDGAEASYRLWYYTPAALLAGALLADRFSSTDSRRRGYAIDFLVAVICLLRPLTGWPPASGHAVFGVYGLLSGSTPTTRVLAILLCGMTLYAKIWLWHWDATLWPGLLVGVIAGMIRRRAQAGASNGDKPHGGFRAFSPPHEP